MLLFILSLRSQTCETFKVTAYTHTGDLTADETPTYGNAGLIVAVDPSVIPLGSYIWIEDIGTVRAADTGKLVKGNVVDRLLDTYEEAVDWGVHYLTVCY